jgi:prepilin-type N-terminal cleavage/methylation domain-containing protein
MRPRSQAGVTLMELLVAVTLFSLVSMGMLMAMRIGLNTYGKTQTHLMDNRRVVGAQRIVEEEIEGMIPVVAQCGGGGPRVPFFQGNPESMRLVSSFSLQGAWRGQPQVLEIFVMPADRGGVRLVVNETPYAGPPQVGLLCAGGSRYIAATPGPRTFVLADNLAFCRFQYLSQPENPNAPPQWGPVYQSKTWPLAVRIQMTPLEPDLSRLQPITVTAPLRIRRSTEIPYDDLPPRAQ